MKEQLIDELLTYFVNENSKYGKITFPNNIDEKRKMLRGITNMRYPNYLDEKILKLEDKLLKIELEEKGIVDALSLKEVEKNIALFLGDITTLKADAIVNAGNSDGLGCFSPNHGCIDNAIHTYAGIRLRLECKEKLDNKKIPVGGIIVCKGYNLPCDYVITTVGPQICGEVTLNDEEALSNCYKNSLKYAVEHNFKTIVFPSISTGVFGYPIGKSKYVVYNTVKGFLKTNDIKVVFNLFSKGDYDEYKALFSN